MLNAPLIQGGLPGTGQQVQDHFTVRGRAEDRAAPLELTADRQGIDDIAVVGDGDRAAVGVDADRLGIAQTARAGGRVANVTDRVASRQPLERLGVEGIRHQPHGPMGGVFPTVAGHDAAAFLASVLQGIEPQINDVCGLLMTRNGEHTTLVMKMIRLTLLAQRLGLGASEGLKGGGLEAPRFKRRRLGS